MVALSRFGNSVELRKQILDARLEQLARTLLLFVVGKQIENAIQGIELFPKTPDLTQNGLNFVEHVRMLAGWQLFFSERLNQFVEIFNPLGPSDEHLDAARIANHVGFAVLVDSDFASRSAQKTGDGSHISVSDGR